MKKLIFITALLAFTFFGCNTENSVVESDTAISTASKTEVNWIKLPPSKEQQLRKNKSVDKDVWGRFGGVLWIYDDYDGGIHGHVNVAASLIFMPGSFNGNRHISMNINDKYGEGTFSPHGVFNKAALYNVKIVGADLTSVDPANVGFVYLAEDGSYEQVENDGIYVDVATGTLQIVNARLPHFSRYGFTN